MSRSLSRSLKRGFLIAAMVFGLSSVSHGKVFFRWGTQAQSSHALKSAGGKLVYEATVGINAGKGQLTIFSFDKDIPEVAQILRGLFGITRASSSGAKMKIITVASGNRMLRLLCLRLAGQTQTLVFKLEQSKSAFEQSRLPPKKNLLKQAPAYPDSAPTLFMKNEDTRFEFAISTSPSPPSAIHAFYASRMRAGGWKPVSSGDSAMAVYLKGPNICCVFTDTTKAGESRITVLHKKHGL